MKKTAQTHKQVSNEVHVRPRAILFEILTLLDIITLDEWRRTIHKCVCVCVLGYFAMTDKINCKIEAERQKFMKLTRAMFSVVIIIIHDS